MNRKRLIWVSLVVLIVGALGGIIIFRIINRTYPVTIQTNTSSIEATQITFNGSSHEATTSHANKANFDLKKGIYTINVTQAGYKPFKTTITVDNGPMITINAHLEPLTTVPIASSSQIIGLDSSLTLSNIQYFYNQTWAVMQVSNNNTDPAIIVTKYDATQNTWVIALGPGTFFTSESTSNLPSQVRSYLNTQAGE